ncbi:AAA family ATPase [Deltaproteobacteria bacterium TL4]
MFKPGVRNIAYGVADFENLRTSGDYFVDKTRFIPLLEQNRYLFFIRPRRFGKSLWVSILETYYDISKKDRFDEFFKGTWIGENPTDECNQYLILSFNFSAVNADVDKIEQSFSGYGERMLSAFLTKYQSWIGENVVKEIRQVEGLSNQLNALLIHARALELPLYILIDEYDNFANTILSTVGENAYRHLTHGEGFFRHFFSVLKEGTSHSGSGLKRLYVTGVSPITMDDVTSGFNIGKNLSLSPVFREMVGFTYEEVQTMLEYYHKKGVFLQNIDESMALMSEWYNGYCFGDESKPSVYNTDMVLYFVQDSIQTGKKPRELIDQNIRIDYGKLRHLLLVNHRLNGNFNHLKQIIENGETVSPVNSSFPLEQLTVTENFISLLYYFGLLSISGTEMGMLKLKIPNRAVKQLMYGYLREAYRDVDTFRVDFRELSHLVQRMAWLGEWEAFFDMLASAIQEQTSIRDYMEGEKVIQGFLLAYLHICDFFLTRTEQELGKGFADILLEPFIAKYPDIPYGYVMELKYFKRGDYKKEKLQATIDEANEQLRKYLADERIQRFERINFQGIVLVFNGWEMVYRGSGD